jgi:hypothetical protein
LHREDGPAWTCHNDRRCITIEKYYLNGEEIERKKFLYINQQMGKIREILEKQNQNRRIRL